MMQNEKEKLINKIKSSIGALVFVAFMLGWGLIDHISDMNTRNNTYITIIDSGVNLDKINHEGFKITTYNAMDKSKNVKDNNGHGTIIVNEFINQTRDLDIKPEILVIKAFDNYDKVNDKVVSRALNYACEVGGGDLINMSFSLKNSSKQLEKEVNNCHKKGITMIASAGDNQSTVVNYPAKYKDIISVRSSDKKDNTVDVSVNLGNLKTCNEQCIKNNTNSVATLIASSYIISEIEKNNINIVHQLDGLFIKE